jgi:addiction module RelE/StbE family toxin
VTKVFLSKKFRKNYKKRIYPYQSKVSKFKQRLNLFIDNQNNPILRDHALKGEKNTFRSFSIAGDIRVIYYIKVDTCVFLDIGSHNQVY